MPAIAVEPVPDAPFEKVPLYNEELVIIAAAGHPPIRSARDVQARDRFWCSSRAVRGASGSRTGSRRTGDMPERMIEITSYHAMLGCVVVGMGISLVPRMVLDTFPERNRLSVHPLPPDLRHAQTS